MQTGHRETDDLDFSLFGAILIFYILALFEFCCLNLCILLKLICFVAGFVATIYVGRLQNTNNVVLSGTIRKAYHFWCQITRVIVLSCGIKVSAVHYLILSQSTRGTDRQTDGRTDRQNYDS